MSSRVSFTMWRSNISVLYVCAPFRGNGGSWLRLGWPMGHPPSLLSVVGRVRAGGERERERENVRKRRWPAPIEGMQSGHRRCWLIPGSSFVELEYVRGSCGVARSFVAAQVVDSELRNGERWMRVVAPSL